jgi:hypothetical protein
MHISSPRQDDDELQPNNQGNQYENGWVSSSSNEQCVPRRCHYFRPEVVSSPEPPPLMRTNTLTGGSSCFSDPQWRNYPRRLYRLRAAE